VNENRILKGACQEIGRTRIFSDDQKQTLTTVFQKRFQQAFVLVEAGKVRKYQFSPSGRTVWVWSVAVETIRFFLTACFVLATITISG